MIYLLPISTKAQEVKFLQNVSWGKKKGNCRQYSKKCLPTRSNFRSSSMPIENQLKLVYVVLTNLLQASTKSYCVVERISTQFSLSQHDAETKHPLKKTIS
ncbi:hypothetical protein PR048_002109 [Dryococelus australis]|uniref:Uncharacterized protein n=1 Tax=Dryococelus australis TaxID=614101 RepID=A0ABQ9IJ88_9NEOP|nr:hypothetical protein PR048_002109 [Dryococelus australis]